MAALRYAATARRALAGQAPQPIYRAAAAVEQPRVLPPVIDGGSSAYSRPFSTIQGGEADPLTFEEKIKIYKRGAHLIFRAIKAASGIVACGIVTKIALSELLDPGYVVRETTCIFKKYHVMRNPSEMDVNMLDDEAVVAAKVAELKSMLKDASPEAVAKLVEESFRE